MKKVEMFILMVFLGLALAACESRDPKYPTQDLCLRAELFKQCMASLPKGPEFTHYNDWDEVVDSCDNVSARQSYRPEELIKNECRFK